MWFSVRYKNSNASLSLNLWPVVLLPWIDLQLFLIHQIYGRWLFNFVSGLFFRCKTIQTEACLSHNFHPRRSLDLFLRKEKDPCEPTLVLLMLSFSASAWCPIVSGPECFLPVFKHAVNSSTRLPGPTMRVSAAGSEAKARGSISANNRRSQSFNNYDKSKPGLLPPTPTSSNDKGKQLIIWSFPNNGFSWEEIGFFVNLQKL